MLYRGPEPLSEAHTLRKKNMEMARAHEIGAHERSVDDVAAGRIRSDVSSYVPHVCKLGHEGIVAKRRDLAYESGRSRRWIKIKNPDSPVARRAEDGTF